MRQPSARRARARPAAREIAPAKIPKEKRARPNHSEEDSEMKDTREAARLAPEALNLDEVGEALDMLDFVLMALSADTDPIWNEHADAGLCEVIHNALAVLRSAFALMHCGSGAPTLGEVPLMCPCGAYPGRAPIYTQGKEATCCCGVM